jgi:DNA-binding MarR family transcriptional regulator
MAVAGSSRDQVVAEIMLAVRRQFAYAVLFSYQVAERQGLSPRETQFMNLLDLYGPLTAGQLAELTGLSTGTVTGVLDRLEQSGYAQRGRDLEDRRKVVVTLGVERITREIAPLYEPKADQLGQVLARYSPSELNLIADFVSRFADASTPRPADALRHRQGADALDKS